MFADSLLPFPRFHRWTVFTFVNNESIYFFFHFFFSQLANRFLFHIQCKTMVNCQSIHKLEAKTLEHQLTFGFHLHKGCQAISCKRHGIMRVMSKHLKKTTFSWWLLPRLIPKKPFSITLKLFTNLHCSNISRWHIANIPCKAKSL